MDDILRPSSCSRLKLKIKKRNSFSGRTLKSKAQAIPLSPLSNILNGRPRKDVGHCKRKNPFLFDRNEEKRGRYEEERTFENKENDFSHFKIAKGVENCVLKGEHQVYTCGTDFENNDGKSETPQGDKTSSHQKSCEGFPTDWSLKTKIRFKSDKAFSWCTNLKSANSSKGTVNFVRCMNESVLDSEMERDTALKVNFRKNLSYWKHPHLPCIPSFPLPENDNQLLERSFTNICKEVALQKNIMTTWTHSFQSVFSLARCGFCPYFYMCCQKFSCLFIGSGVLDEGMVSIITPTTKGFRQLLLKEGIEFEMPHFKKDGQKNESEENSLNDTENGGDDTDGDFLSSIGLSNSQFASIEKQRFANEISQLNAVDNRAQSTVFVKDCHVNALFNFLVNSDVTVAQSGTWQGVPPTLLSPVAFEGASLQTMQCIQGPMKVPYKGGMKQINCLEISGPVLPHQFYSICQLVREVNGSFEATIYSNTQSNAFNCQPNDQKITMQEDNTADLGLSKSCLDYLRKSSWNTIEALTQLHFSDGIFEWKTHSL